MATGGQPGNAQPQVSTYHRRQVVRFRSLEKHKEDAFCLKLSYTLTCGAVMKKVAKHLGLDDSKTIRLTSHNCHAQQPYRHPIKSLSDHLSSMLVHKNKRSDILYYEVLDCRRKVEGQKTLDITFHYDTKAKVSMHSITLSGRSIVGDLLDDLKAEVELSLPNAKLRLLQIIGNRIRKIYPLTEKIENIYTQYSSRLSLHAEEIPEDEKNLGPRDRLIHVCHFRKDAPVAMEVRNSGKPFFFVIHEGETLAEIKLRIQKKLHVRDREFSKWKFAFMWGTPEYLQDSDIVFSRFREGRNTSGGGWEQYLGLEHYDDSVHKGAYSANRIKNTNSLQKNWYTPLKNPGKGYILNDVEAKVSIRRPIKKQKVDDPVVMVYSSDNSEEGSALLGRSVKAESQAGVPIEVEVLNEDNEEVDQINASVPNLEMQTEIDGKINEPVVVEEGSTKVQLTEQVPKPETQDEVKTPLPSTQSSEIAPAPEYPGAGQLYEEGRNRQEVLDEKFVDIGGFSILRTQASLYKQIWLKYGHIASSQVLMALYPVQVTLVSHIMTFVMDMHHCRLGEVSSAMIDTWENKIKMAETIKFNIKWLRELFENVKKDSSWEKELKTTILLEKDQFIQDAQARVTALEDELKKARANLSTLQTEKQIHLEKGSHLLFDGLF